MEHIEFTLELEWTHYMIQEKDHGAEIYYNF